MIKFAPSEWSVFTPGQVSQIKVHWEIELACYLSKMQATSEKSDNGKLAHIRTFLGIYIFSAL